MFLIKSKNDDKNFLKNIFSNLYVTVLWGNGQPCGWGYIGDGNGIE